MHVTDSCQVMSQFANTQLTYAHIDMHTKSEGLRETINPVFSLREGGRQTKHP